MQAPLLEVRELHVEYRATRSGRAVTFAAVHGVTLSLSAGETLAIVGESGCGKSTLARAIVRLVDPARGSIRVFGSDWLAARGSVLRHRRAVIQMVFQNPYGSLNPRLSIARAVEEPLLLHTSLGRAERRRRAIELLAMVGIGRDLAERRPRDLSGGQRQRVAIARAIACEPRLVICDEPTASLDVSVQAQVLNLLIELQSRLGIGYLFITHDLSVVRHVAHRVCVMYMGQVVEEGETEDLLSRPLHPYTLALLQAVADSDPSWACETDLLVRGEPGDPAQPPAGCRYHPRCAFAMDVCRAVDPQQEAVAPGRTVACHAWRALAQRSPARVMAERLS